MQARLLPIEGLPCEPIAWREGSKRIGRHPDSHIVIQSHLVSRHHAKVELRGEEATVMDEGSRNGTFVNGRRITEEVALGHGDVIAVGGWKARFERESPRKDRPCFVVIEGASRRDIFGDSATMGRWSGATLVVRHPAVSRLHATVIHKDGTFRLHDAGSTHGTYVNGRRVVEQNLRSGDVVALGVDPGGAGTPDGKALQSIQVQIRDDSCTLNVQEPAADAESLPEEAPTARFRRRAADEITHAFSTGKILPSLEAPVIKVPARPAGARGKRLWVPTSDIKPHFSRRLLTIGLGFLALVAGLLSLHLQSASFLTPGGLGGPHGSDKFLSMAGTGPLCDNCHLSWKGAPDTSCLSCHEIETGEGHENLAVPCARCHREHEPRDKGDKEGKRKVQVKVGRHRCMDCHGDAHGPPPDTGGQATEMKFLNRSFTKPFIHSDHRSLECTRCHAWQKGSEAGPRTAGCQDCHGGGRGMDDARCHTCHRYHVPAENHLREEKATYP